MGLCNLPGVNDFILERKKINLLYRECLNGPGIGFPLIPGDIEYNYSYFPVFFSSEEKMLEMKDILYKNGINARRYFYPSLNKLPYLSTQSCPVSERTASIVLCLPVFNGMSADDIKFISDVINKNI